MAKSHASEAGATALSNLLTWGAALPVLEELARLGIPVIVLKSLPLVEDLYGNAGGRMTHDVDILIPGPRAEEALRVAQGLEWKLLRPDSFAALSKLVGPQRAASRETWHLIGAAGPDGPGRLDIHSDAMESWRHPPLDPDVWNRAQSGSVGEAPFMLLGAEDRLIFLCWHYVLDGFPTSKLQDIRMALVAADEVDWRVVAERAEATGMMTVVSLVCELAFGRSDRPFDPGWRSLPVKARIRRRLLLLLLSRVRGDLGEKLQVAVRIVCYDRAGHILDAARAAFMPSKIQLAGYGLGYDPSRESYWSGLVRHYSSRLRV